MPLQPRSLCRQLQTTTALVLVRRCSPSRTSPPKPPHLCGSVGMFAGRPGCQISPLAQSLSEVQPVLTMQAMVQNMDLTAKQTRFLVFVEDFQAQHLDAIYANSQCSLTKAWKAFNKQHQGHHHRALVLCRTMLGYLLPLGMLATLAA